jgi:hypothetical protein
MDVDETEDQLHDVERKGYLGKRRLLIYPSMSQSFWETETHIGEYG